MKKHAQTSAIQVQEYVQAMGIKSAATMTLMNVLNGVAQCLVRIITHAAAVSAMKRSLCVAMNVLRIPAPAMPMVLKSVETMTATVVWNGER